MFKKFILIPIISIFISGCALANTTGKLITGSPNSTNFEANTIQIKDFAFSPSEVSAVAGSVITITNTDSTPHSVSANDKSFETGTINPGESVTIKAPNTEGVYPFHCNFHAYMRGNLTVIGNITPTPTE